MFQEGRESSYLAASFCSSARLFCSSWARWSSRSRALRASTSAARFASASLLGSTSYRPRLLTMLRLWFANAIFYRVNFCTSYVTIGVTKFMVHVIQKVIPCIVSSFYESIMSDTTVGHAALVLVLYNSWVIYTTMIFFTYFCFSRASAASFSFLSLSAFSCCCCSRRLALNIFVVQWNLMDRRQSLRVSRDSLP